MRCDIGNAWGDPVAFTVFSLIGGIVETLMAVIGCYGVTFLGGVAIGRVCSDGTERWRDCAALGLVTSALCGTALLMLFTVVNVL